MEEEGALLPRVAWPPPGTIKGGDEVTIKGFHARDASQNVGAAREIVMADGRAFAVGPLIGPGR